MPSHVRASTQFPPEKKLAPVSNDGEVSGITWIELFVLFDIAGERTEQGQYQKNPAAIKRAGKRKLVSRCAKGKRSNLNNTTVITKATLDEEIKEFKSIVRHIFKHEVRQGKGKWVRMDNRSNLSRLNDLGIFGHQPAIKAYCQMTKGEKTQITESILKQKIANTEKRKSSLQSTGKGKEERKPPSKPVTPTKITRIPFYFV